MMDNAIGLLGVCGSVFLAQAATPTAGWEQVGALGILGMTMYFLLTRQSAQLDKLSDKITRLINLISTNEEDKKEE